MVISKGYANTASGQVHYRHVAGPGTPVLFFHRTPVWSSSFERVFQELAGWRALYAFDTPGFGESFTPMAGMTMADYRDTFIEAIDALGIDGFHLCGHHTGGHFAIEIAAHAPARTRSLLIDGAMYHGPEERAARRARRSPAPAIDRGGAYIVNSWAFLQPFYPDFVPDLIHQEFVGAMRSLPTRDVLFDAMQDQDFPEVLSRVRCPVHACAAQDDVYADLLPRIAADLPHITISTYGRAGIAGPELQPADFARTVRMSVERA